MKTYLKALSLFGIVMVWLFGTIGCVGIVAYSDKGIHDHVLSWMVGFGGVLAAIALLALAIPYGILVAEIVE